jgi:hypothetical protein
LTDPPSVDGTSGPQLVFEEAPAPAPADDPGAEVFAVCVDVVDVSPGNCAGISGSTDPLPFAVPNAPPPEPKPPCDDGKGDVGTLNGSDAALLLPVLVWACPNEKPRRMTARAKPGVRCMVLSWRKLRRAGLFDRVDKQRPIGQKGK